jgi:4-hydroxybenzoate polyprenyltransferase
VAYVLNNLLYSLYIKHIAILDVMSIATGFCLRLLAGVYILSDIPTTWIIICTFFLATFLGFAKRHSEYFDSDTLRKSQRPVLISYTPELLNSLLNNSAVMIILSYALFTTSSGKNPTLVVTVPVVFFAVMYYTKLVLSTASTSEPDLIILKNRTMQLTIVLWLILYLSITSQHLQFFR